MNEKDRDNLPSQCDRGEHKLSDKQRYTNNDDEEKITKSMQYL